MLDSRATSYAQGWGVPRVALHLAIRDLEDMRGVCEPEDMERLGADLVGLTRGLVRDVDTVLWDQGALSIVLHDAGPATAELVARRVRERLPGAVDVRGYLVPIDVAVEVRSL